MISVLAGGSGGARFTAVGSFGLIVAGKDAVTFAGRVRFVDGFVRCVRTDAVFADRQDVSRGSTQCKTDRAGTSCCGRTTPDLLFARPGGVFGDAISVEAGRFSGGMLHAADCGIRSWKASGYGTLGGLCVAVVLPSSDVALQLCQSAQSACLAMGS